MTGVMYALMKGLCELLALPRQPKAFDVVIELAVQRCLNGCVLLAT